MLGEIFVGQRSSPTLGDKPASQTAPGMSTALSRLGSQRTASAGADGSTSAPDATSPRTAGGTTATRAASPNRLAVAFENFANTDQDAEATTSSFRPTDNNARGIFQNVRITANNAENSIVVYSNQEDYRVIEGALRQIDRPKLQVAIEATIAEVTLTDELQFGVQYFFANNKGAVGLLSPTAQPIAAGQEAVQATLQSAFVQKVAPGLNLLLGPGAQPKIILTALSALTDVKVISAPSVVVMDKEPALLQVGEEVPISTGVATVLSSPSTPVVNTIEMRNTGVILKVLPNVSANGTIQLEIEQEISNVVNPNQATLTPTISQRRLHSTVSVTNGQTVLLGGLISEQDQKTKGGLPVLNDIPVFGDLFGTKILRKQRTEIIMFIKPQLVRNSIDARQVAEEFRDRLQMMRGETSYVNGSDVTRLRTLPTK